MPMQYCLNCNKAFHVYPSELKIGWGKYCCRECYDAVRCKKAPNKKTLTKLYYIQSLSAVDIAKKFSVCKSTVLKWLKQWSIGRRTNAEARKLQWRDLKYRKNVICGLRGRQYFETSKWKGISKEVLKSLYWKDGKSSLEIAKEFGVCSDAILRTMRKYGIPRRSKIQLALKSLGRRNSPKTEFKTGDTPWWIKRGKQNPAKDDEILKKMLHIQKPSKPEKKVISIIEEEELDLKYVGDGKVIIGGKCPDFINVRKKVVVEVFGRYWHDRTKNPKIELCRTYKATLQHYHSYGYNCLIIWDDELHDNAKVVEKIRTFMGD